MENNWDAWAKEWENANAFYTSKGNNKTKDNLKSKWNKEFMNILKYFYNEGRRIERDEIKKKINKLKWTLKDVDNKEIEEATHYSGNEVFMDMHNEDLQELLNSLEEK